MNLIAQKIKLITSDLKEEFLDKKGDTSEISIFLCGGASKEQGRLRRNIGTELTNIKSKFAYTVHYPEDMFMEQIFGYKKHDLLSLENLLADSVHVIVILLQSAGTLVELGAFANHKFLCDKLVVLIDKKYKKTRSFVNQGPVKYLKDKTRSHVAFTSLNDEKEVTKIAAQLSRKVYKHSSRVTTLENPVVSMNFYLALIHTFDPVPRQSIPHIISLLGASEAAITSAETITNTLINNGSISLKNSQLSITNSGKNTLLSFCQSHKERKEKDRYLTTTRCGALNLQLRGSNKHRSSFWESVVDV